MIGNAYCQCGYPTTPCDKQKNSWGHMCLFAKEARTEGLREQARVVAGPPGEHTSDDPGEE